MKQTILAISGKPGLYKLVSRASNSLIVEALDETHKRMPAFGSDRITSLADIAMFRKARSQALISKKPLLPSCTSISPRYCPNGIRTVCRTATSRNSSSGTTSLSKLASPTLRKRWHLLRVTTLITEKKKPKPLLIAKNRAIALFFLSL